jgi:aryl-alcohol dehydrogenase-like predicted oxidoreductase
MLKSRASAEETKSYSEKYPELLYKKLGTTNLTVSACGFGAYRVDYRVSEHFRSLEYAISNGINIIDTSSNYSDGGSEILIGNVLGDMINKNLIKREEMVIVSKGGYIQGKNLEAAKKMKAEGIGYKEVTEYAENIWHCIHPDFIKDQITFSLERMKLETIDVYLLHNPEYFLDSSIRKELDIEEIRHEYYNRIKKAFAYLEEEVSKGRIGAYGISSNAFVKDSDDPLFTSLQLCAESANEISENNNFKVIELPLNLYETGAVSNKNQIGDLYTVLDYAFESSIGVLVNRPLNAIINNRLKRTADFKVNKDLIKPDDNYIIAEINLLDMMENEFLNEYLDVLNLSENNKDAVTHFLKAGEILKENWKNFGTIENFNDIKKQFLIPRVNYAFTVLVKSPNLTEEMKNKLNKIATQINKLTEIIESIYGLLANTENKDIHNKLNSLAEDSYSEKFSKLTLSQKAIVLINSLKEVSSTLVGMRQESYVDDVIGALKSGLIANASEKLCKLNLQ